VDRGPEALGPIELQFVDGTLMDADGGRTGVAVIAA
jgi:hypothetical protein